MWKHGKKLSGTCGFSKTSTLCNTVCVSWGQRGGCCLCQRMFQRKVSPPSQWWHVWLFASTVLSPLSSNQTGHLVWATGTSDRCGVKGGGAMSTGWSLPGNGKGQLNYRHWFMFDSYITVDQHLNGSRKFRYSLLIEPLYCTRWYLSAGKT